MFLLKKRIGLNGEKIGSDSNNVFIKRYNDNI